MTLFFSLLLHLISIIIIICDLHVLQLYENDSEDIVEPAHKRLRSSSYNDEQSSLHLLRTATTLTDYSSDDDADDQDRESVHSWQGYETGKPTKDSILNSDNKIRNQSNFRFYMTDWVGDSGDEWCPSDNFQDKDEDSLTEFELADESDDESDQFSDCSSSSQLSVRIRYLIRHNTLFISSIFYCCTGCAFGARLDTRLPNK